MPKRKCKKVHKRLSVLVHQDGARAPKRVEVHVYRPARTPESPHYAQPTVSLKNPSSEGLGGNIALDTLGPNWWQFGGGGL